MSPEPRNFRRLENISAGIEERETVFVGPNNSGKTSATAIFRCFLGQRKFRIYDFSVARIGEFDAFGVNGEADSLPSIELDIWFKVDPDSIEFGRAFTLLPNLSDNFERLGVRLRYATPDPVKLREAYSRRVTYRRHHVQSSLALRTSIATRTAVDGDQP